MPLVLRWVYEEDGFDRTMYKSGWVSEHKAAEWLNRSADSLRLQAHPDGLGYQDRGDRRYYDLDDITDIYHGRSYHARHERERQERAAEWAAAGLPPSSVSRTVDSLPTPFQRYQVMYGKGGA